ncbi:MAG: NF038130 family PEP-CTERM protein [Calothrix sp. C42_A2020_038]|nr:NF038130 family PEP-CTERM protein [Calothrix sp. C42_A2020_038]
MKKTVRKLLIGASMVVSANAMVSAPVHAASLTNISIGGSNASDYFVYDVNGNNTVRVQNSLANVQKALNGNAASPGGNVELAASSEARGFDFTKNTTLTGQIGGKDITLSSLTMADWSSSVGGGLTFAQKWFNDALTANGFGGIIGSAIYNAAFAKFNINGGYQRFSDPNISYVNQDDNTGEIKIGLAGHFDATSLLFAGLSVQEQLLINSFRTKTGPIQASEIVKVSYNGGPSQFLYSFNATRSGLVAADDSMSHNGNYEVSFQGIVPTSQAVPEPSVMLGMLGVAGAFGVRRKLKKAQA